jgi:hypothetical protein
MIEMEGRDEQDGAMTETTATCDQGAGSPKHRYTCTHIPGVATQTTTASVYRCEHLKSDKNMSVNELYEK